MQRRRPYVLMELLISFSIFASIMMILFQSFREFTKAKFDLKKLQEIVLPRQRLQLRLSQIFSQLISVEDQKDGNFYFFNYDNGPDLDEDFRGTVEGMLTLTQNQLVLITWSKKNATRKEILFEPANDLHIEFFDEKTGTFSKKCPEDKPFMIKLKINGIEFPFFI